MDVRIGIKQSPRELAFETDETADEIRALINTADDRGFVALTDTKGKQILVAVDSIAFIEFGGDAGRKVGFVS